jgi:hypothetical protein
MEQPVVLLWIFIGAWKYEIIAYIHDSNMTSIKRHTRYYSITLSQVRYTTIMAVPCDSRCEITVTTECKALFSVTKDFRKTSWISVRSGILHLPAKISRVVFLLDCGCLCRLEKIISRSEETRRIWSTCVKYRTEAIICWREVNPL